MRFTALAGDYVVILDADTEALPVLTASGRAGSPVKKPTAAAGNGPGGEDMFHRIAAHPPSQGADNRGLLRYYLVLLPLGR